MGALHIRRPAVAGMFYPAQPDKLRRVTEEYINGAPVTSAPERVVALVAPHAGYVYSGPSAGYAYARVRGKKPERVVLLGCSHRYHFSGASIYRSGAFETPLGSLPVDEEFADRLVAEIGSESAEPHGPEHAIEVHLPFLLLALGEVPIVPVLFGSPADGWHAEVGETLAKMSGPNDLLVASTDLSHYLTLGEADALDHHSLSTLLSQRWQKYVEEIATGEASMCGAAAVTAAMSYALNRGARDWTVLDYRTSADASGDTSRVVGYAAVSMEKAA